MQQHSESSIQIGSQTRRVVGADQAPPLPITGAPVDADLARVALVHGAERERLFVFKASSRDTVYQFAWDGTSYAFAAHSVIPVLTLAGMPPDANPATLTMHCDDWGYHAEVERFGDASARYRFTWMPGTTTYQPCFLTD